MNPETLPGRRRDQPLARMIKSGEIVEFRFADGHLEKRTVEQIRDFLNETEERDESLLPTRVTPIIEVGDVLSWDEHGRRTYGRLDEKAYSTQGPHLIVSPYDKEDRLLGIQVTIRWSEIKTVMSHDAWQSWHGEDPAPKGDVLVEPATGEEAKNILWYVLVERLAKNSGIGRFERMYAGVHSYKQAREMREELMAVGVVSERISILRDESERAANQKFGALLHGTITGQAILWVLRLVHPQYRRRRCLNSSGNPKKTYAEKTMAVAEVQRIRPSGNKKPSVYHCRSHRGWHIGNT